MPGGEDLDALSSVVPAPDSVSVKNGEARTAESPEFAPPEREERTAPPRMASTMATPATPIFPAVILRPSQMSFEELRGHEESARTLPTVTEAGMLDATQLPALIPAGPPREGTPFGTRPPEELARWEQLVADYEREIRALGNDPRSVPLYLEVGRIYEEMLGKPRLAATSYQRAFNLNPRDPAVLHASRRLFTEVGNWAMVVQILGFEIESAPTLERRATLAAEKGLIQEDKLRNPEDAQKSFKEALASWPAEPLAQAALERLLLQRKDYEALDGVYERALGVLTTPERRLPLLLARAQLAEDRREQPEQALAGYREILALAPGHPRALEALRRLLSRGGHWEDYVQVLMVSAASAPEVAAQHLLAASRVLKQKLSAMDRALVVLLQALESAPEDLVVLKEIERLYEENDRPDEVVKVLRREIEVTVESNERVPMLHKLATVLEERLNLADEAVLAYGEAVRLDPSFVPARQGLGRLYERAGRWAELAELYETEIRIEEDPASRVVKLFKLAELRETKLGKVEDAIVTLRALLGVKRDYAPARKYLERLLDRRDAHAELVAFYEEELGLTEDRAQRVFLLLRIGALTEDHLGDLDGAISAYSRILEIEPRHLSALRALGRLAQRQERWAEVLRLLELEVEATADPKEIVALYHRAGSIFEERRNDADAAILWYERARALDPGYLPAVRALGRLYRQRGRWEDLVGMYLREAEVSAPEAARGLWLRAAEVLRQELRDDARAAELYETVLGQDPRELNALRALELIRARQGDIEKQVDALLRQAGALSDPKEKATILVRVAELCEEKLERADRAAEIYLEVLRLGHHFDAAIRALVRIYSAEGLWSSLSRALRTAFEHATDDASKVAILLRSAEVAAERLGNLDVAQEALEEARRLHPDDLAVLVQLERAASMRRDWAKVVEVGSILARYERDPRLFAARHVRLAEIKETHLEPPESGAEHHRLALQTVPDHPVALRALELAYLRAGNWAALAPFYQRQAMVCRSDTEKVALFARAADLAELRLMQDGYAAEMYERALEISPSHLPSLRGRRRVAERAGDAHIALDCLKREAELTADPRHGVELLFEVGRVFQDQFKDRARALETYQNVLTRVPDHLGAFNRLEGILLEQEAWGPMRLLLEQRAQAVIEPEAQAKLFFAAGQVAEEKLHDAPAAMGLYGKVLERNKQHAGALVRLGPLLFSAGRWDDALDVLHRTLAVTKEREVLAQTFKSLGIIYQEHRQDLVKCVQSFQAALQAAPGDTECLRRLALVYREAQDWVSAINVLLRLAEVEPSPRAKIDTLLELGRVYEQGAKDRSSAILANKKVLELEPTNQEAILRLSDLYEQSEDWAALAEVSGAYIRLLPPEHRHRAAPLHLKMADIFETKL